MIDNDFSTEHFSAGRLWVYQSLLKKDQHQSIILQIALTREILLALRHELNFGATYGASNADLLKEMEDKQKGLEGLFLHKLMQIKMVLKLLLSIEL